MIRSGFKRQQIERKRTVHTPIDPKHRRSASMGSVTAVHEHIEKENAVRSEAYRRLVAAMPCANCRREGRSQHAHENEGKGKALKLDDRRAMPLCADEPGSLGCHSRFDRYALFLDREEHIRMGQQWAEETRAQIEESGQWPKILPRWTA